MHLKAMVSVIMPARNVEPYIHEAVQSVLAQKGITFELLIADDASRDKTWDQIKTYRNHSRVRIWRFNERKGPADAANFLMKRAKGQYLFFCDADDILPSKALLSLSAVLRRRPQVGVVYGNRLILKKSGELCAQRRSSNSWDLLEGSISKGGTMMRRALLKKIHGFRSEMPYLEDCEFFSRLYDVTQFHYLKAKPVYIYRRQRGSITEKFKKKFKTYRLKIFRETILRRYGFRVAW